MDKWIEESIQATKGGFEKSFNEGSLYNTQTQDERHIEKILKACDIVENSEILDLGTGSGYLAFSIANNYPKSKVIGLDIVENTLNENRKRALDINMKNIEFFSYEGIIFPFADEKFDYVTSRYALHHFPVIDKTLKEISRVLKKGGHLFLSDPTPNDNDVDRFVDDYMQMKKDGHVKYYTREEFEYYANKVGLKLIDSFQTEICFPRLKDTAIGFDDIIKKHKDEIISAYKVKVTADNKYIYTTQKVWNLLFEKYK